MMDTVQNIFPMIEEWCLLKVSSTYITHARDHWSWHIAEKFYSWERSEGLIFGGVEILFRRKFRLIFKFLLDAIGCYILHLSSPSDSAVVTFCFANRSVNCDWYRGVWGEDVPLRFGKFQEFKCAQNAIWCIGAIIFISKMLPLSRPPRDQFAVLNLH